MSATVRINAFIEKANETVANLRTSLMLLELGDLPMIRAKGEEWGTPLAEDDAKQLLTFYTENQEMKPFEERSNFTS